MEALQRPLRSIRPRWKCLLLSTMCGSDGLERSKEKPKVRIDIFVPCSGSSLFPPEDH